MLSLDLFEGLKLDAIPGNGIAPQSCISVRDNLASEHSLECVRGLGDLLCFFSLDS